MVVSIADNFSDFAKYLNERTGENINLCFQCKKCSSGCPVSTFMDYMPNQIIHYARLGLKEIVLKSKTIWLCAACETCTTRCPQGIDLVKVMDSLKNIADRSGIKPGDSQVSAFYHKGISNIRHFGRMYEAGLIGMLKISTGQLTGDLGLGLKMFKKGKLKLLPTFKGSRSMKNIFSRVKKAEKR